MTSSEKKKSSCRCSILRYTHIYILNRNLYVLKKKNYNWLLFLSFKLHFCIYSYPWMLSLTFRNTVVFIYSHMVVADDCDFTLDINPCIHLSFHPVKSPSSHHIRFHSFLFYMIAWVDIDEFNQILLAYCYWVKLVWGCCWVNILIMDRVFCP